MTKSNFKI